MPVFTSANGASKQNSSGKKMMFCPYCGTKLDDGARFCKNCGVAVLGKNDKSLKSNYRLKGFIVNRHSLRKVAEAIIEFVDFQSVVRASDPVGATGKIWSQNLCC